MESLCKLWNLDQMIHTNIHTIPYNPSNLDSEMSVEKQAPATLEHWREPNRKGATGKKPQPSGENRFQKDSLWSGEGLKH